MSNCFCPSCNREFEMPKRYNARADDFEFIVVPRMLPCLHAVCQSCLVEMRDRSRLGRVTCPVCDVSVTIKGAGYLPYDVSSLTKTLQASSTQTLSECCRCADDTKSFSWCTTCSSALCEFHHQDHKLSLDTAKHDIFTYAEITHRGLRVEPKLPPVSCPEEKGHECSYYCQDCMHVVSLQGTANHAGHKIQLCTDVVHSMKKSIDDACNQTRYSCDKLQAGIENIRSILTSLDNAVDQAEILIETSFDKIRRELDERQEFLKNRVMELASTSRQSLLNQLTSLSLSLSDCRHVYSVTQNFLEDISASTVGPSKDVYIVASCDSILIRADDIVEETKGKLEKYLAPDPSIHAFVNSKEVDLIRNLISSIGSVKIPDAHTISEDGNINVHGYNDVIDRQRKFVSGGLHFAVATQRVKDKHGASSTVGQNVVIDVREYIPNPEASSRHHFDSDSDGGNVVFSRGNELETVRDTTHLPPVDHKSKLLSNHGKNDRLTANVSLGPVLGQIFINNMVDKSILDLGELRSFYESDSQNDVPILRIAVHVTNFEG